MITSNIMKRLEDDYNFLSSKYTVLGVFLFGSQNYETAIDTSDIDVKAIVMPPIEKLLLGKSDVRETHSRSNGELSVFDIASMHACLKKSNINFLEILFTDYKIINPAYENLWNTIITMREDIAYHNKRAAMECIYGCAMYAFERLFTELPSNTDRIQHVGYDYKAWANIHRFWLMMNSYKAHYAYAYLLKIQNIDADVYEHIMSLRTLNYVCTADQIKDAAQVMKNNMKQFMETYREEQRASANEFIIQMIDDVTIDCLKAYINERCYKERWPVLSC